MNLYPASNVVIGARAGRHLRAPSTFEALQYLVSVADLMTTDIQYQSGIKRMDTLGIEPNTSRMLSERDNQLHHVPVCVVAVPRCPWQERFPKSIHRDLAPRIYHQSTTVLDDYAYLRQASSVNDRVYEPYGSPLLRRMRGPAGASELESGYYTFTVQVRRK